MTVTIRALAPDDREAWLPLWQGYLRFYRKRLPPEITDTTFVRLVDPAQQPCGLVAADDAGRLIGLATYLFHRTSWSIAESLYLEDLFVDPAARGLGAGRALILAVYAAADASGAAGVYWQTQDYNADGRALYDTLAHRTSFIRYER